MPVRAFSQAKSRESPLAAAAAAAASSGLAADSKRRRKEAGGRRMKAAGLSMQSMRSTEYRVQTG